MNRFSRTVKFMAMATTGVLWLSTSGCLPHNFWADTAGYLITTAIDTAVGLWTSGLVT